MADGTNLVFRTPCFEKLDGQEQKSCSNGVSAAKRAGGYGNPREPFAKPKRATAAQEPCSR